MNLRRTPKVISIRCPACLVWVKPRRWDKAVGCCFPCSSSSDRPTLFDQAFDALPGLPLVGRPQLTTGKEA
ncbi:hypothetical protein AB0M47_38865 [Hamadaea sp. NPDC051192]|uniref:hypothetical protein n=1 Tax=Hamadaea sp. NPDC051192 TaxID=3154940 RepID=UPI0034257D2F